MERERASVTSVSIPRGDALHQFVLEHPPSRGHRDALRDACPRRNVRSRSVVVQVDMKLTRLEATGYRSLKHVDMTFEPLNVLIGTNASGGVLNFPFSGTDLLSFEALKGERFGDPP